ncbi:hypothetical protein K491DRAFT_725793 [Lophiostoma macrostomum CBS 122681]|uniref:Uncharacterized protein n=1 Tax=Lophiostoma macrostomum CBS 122681 TaxID=1314788 RepID=A0A6A6T2Q4_9PLEO|nr:hypothetical protein K491DRAFT_725793 [Lophiostoma macrostomum CBS 122681]
MLPTSSDGTSSANLELVLASNGVEAYEQSDVPSNTGHEIVLATNAEVVRHEGLSPDTGKDIVLATNFLDIYHKPEPPNTGGELVLALNALDTFAGLPAADASREMVLATKALATYRQPVPSDEGEGLDTATNAIDTEEKEMEDEVLQLEPARDGMLLIEGSYDPIEAFLNDALVDGIRRLNITDEKLAMIQANDAELKVELLARIKANSATSQECMDIDEFGRPRVDEKLVNETLANPLCEMGIADHQGMEMVVENTLNVEMETHSPMEDPVAAIDAAPMMTANTPVSTEDTPPAIENKSAPLKGLPATVEEALATIEPSLDNALSGLAYLEDKYQVPLITKDLARTLRHLKETSAMSVDEPTQIFLLKHSATIKAMLQSGVNFEVDPWDLTPEVIKHYFDPNYISPPKPEVKLSVPPLAKPGHLFTLPAPHPKYDFYSRKGLPHPLEPPSSTAATLGLSDSHKPGPERTLSRRRNAYTRRVESYSLTLAREETFRELIAARRALGPDVAKTEISFSEDSSLDLLVRHAAMEETHTSVSPLRTRPSAPNFNGSTPVWNRRTRAWENTRDNQSVWNGWYGPGK